MALYSYGLYHIWPYTVMGGRGCSGGPPQFHVDRREQGRSVRPIFFLRTTFRWFLATLRRTPTANAEGAGSDRIGGGPRRE